MNALEISANFDNANSLNIPEEDEPSREFTANI
jgi:hypothetical protein